MTTAIDIDAKWPIKEDGDSTESTKYPQTKIKLNLGMKRICQSIWILRKSGMKQT